MSKVHTSNLGVPDQGAHRVSLVARQQVPDGAAVLARVSVHARMAAKAKVKAKAKAKHSLPETTVIQKTVRAAAADF